MSFKIGKISQAKVVVKCFVPDGENMREEKMTVGMNIFSNSVYIAKRQALIDGGAKDVELDFLKNDGITSVDGVEFDDGGTFTVNDALDTPYLRNAIEAHYLATAQGIKRKN